MRPTAIAMFFESSATAIAMCVAGLAVLLIGLWTARRDLASARGMNMDKMVALANVCYAAPLAVFGALHLFGPQFVRDLVPRYMHWRMFWVYFVGCALIAASLSIAAKVAVRWSGLLVGIMMFLFVAMLYFPGGVRQLHAHVPWARSRFTWTIVCRESSFGGGGWLLAATAKNAWRGPMKTTLIIVGRIAIAVAAIFFAIQHFQHPLGLPGVPLQREMPAWVPARAIIDYLTGAALLAAGVSILVNWKARRVAAAAGGWILLTILVIYGPVMIAALGAPGLENKVEGINYFADTLFFAGVLLAAASAAPRSD